MTKINIGILQGGPSLEYDMSLITAQSVKSVLDEDRYNIVDIFIDKNENWLLKGIPVKPFEILLKLDLVFNALHGDYGEDGRVQAILENSKVPFTGPKSFAAALSFHKALALQELLKNKPENLKLQGQMLFSSIELLDKDAKQMAEEVFIKFPAPYVLKPVRGGSSFGVALANTKDELVNLLEKMLMQYDEVLVEEFIFGKELTVSVVEDLRGQELYVAPVAEILKRDKKIFDTDAKYLEAKEETVRIPAQVPDDVKLKIEELSREISMTLQARHYARLDFILAREKDIYFLELNSLPGLGPRSLLPQTLQAVGVDFQSFVEHVISLALEEK